VYAPTFDASSATPLVSLLKHANVYARAAPREKQLIVRCLQGLGHVVCMVGDGANDSFALKSSDAGLSIAAHESFPTEGGEDTLAVPSIAAPFSTPLHHIGAVLLLLREGRAALATSLISFRYMLQYGVTQFVACSRLYTRLSTLSPGAFLVADLVNALPLVMALNLTGSASELRPGLPFTKLASWRFLLALAGNCAVIVAGQAAAVAALSAQPWYDALTPEEGAAGAASQEGTVLFLVSTMSYLTQAVALCHSYGGFRARAVTNRPLVAIVSLLFVFDSALFLLPIPGASRLLQIVDTIPYWFLFVLYVWALVCGLAFMAFERYVVTKREGFWYEQAHGHSAGSDGRSPVPKAASAAAREGYALV
jgi:cation-transporting P-type ATPase 13A2